MNNLEQELYLNQIPLTTAGVYTTALEASTILLDLDSRQKVAASRAFLEEQMANPGATFYGINTGFGALCNTIIAPSQLAQLQLNLIRSHACGAGPRVPTLIVRIIQILKVIGLAKGRSGVRVELIDALLALYNNHITPILYQQGSLGASGDLAPLAHLSLPLIAEGEVEVEGKSISAQKGLTEAGLQPIELQSKEGLALLNGTQFMCGYGVYLIEEGRRLLNSANLTASLACELYHARSEPFNPVIHTVRPHKGQGAVAKAIEGLRAGSPTLLQAALRVQDPYSFRCIPQVHGACADVLNHVASVIDIEIDSVTDNPSIFAEERLIISGGNFHGQNLAFALDYLALAFAEIASISERRCFQLLAGAAGLPPFLATQPGLQSGMMILQYTAAGIVSQNKQYCSPSSIDSIPSSNGQEDHVSMGANAATKAFAILENCWTVLAIELTTAMQAFNLDPLRQTSAALEPVLRAYREQITTHTSDRIMAPEIAASREFLKKQCSCKPLY